MRIGLNLHFLAPGVAGGRVYAEGLLRGLAAVDGENEYACFTRRDTDLPPLPPARFRQVRAPVRGRSTVWRTAWEYGVLPRRVRGTFQLFHGLGNVSPAPGTCPFVLTIHDLVYRRFPRSLPVGHRLFMRWMQPISARRADRIIVPSRRTAEDVIERLAVPEERVRVVAYGPGHGFQRVLDGGVIAESLKRLGVEAPFVVSVARGYDHKNLNGLVHAFARLREIGHRDTRLVLIGDRYRTGAALMHSTRRLRLGDAVVFTGTVRRDDLNALYSAASLFAFPSLAEGFGLPVLEAMACGAPVVASDASAVPEAVGGAGLLADARDPDAFAEAMARVLDDTSLQAVLRDKGLARAQEFSWERCAADTLAVYRELA